MTEEEETKKQLDEVLNQEQLQNPDTANDLSAATITQPLPTELTPIGTQEDQSAQASDLQDQIEQSQSSAQESSLPPPSHKGAKVVKVNSDGSTSWSNGVTYYPGQGISWGPIGGLIHSKSDPNGKTISRPVQQPQVVTNPASGEQYLLDKTTKKMSKIEYPTDPNLVNLPADANKDEVLKSLSPEDRAKVEGYSRYKLPISPYGISRDKNLNHLLPYIMKVNPDFSAANYRQNQDTIVDYGTKGKTGQNIGSFNMVINHLGHLQEVSQKLGGTKPLSWNQLIQSGQRQLGDPTLASYKTSALAVEQEFARMLKNGATDQKEIDEWRDRLSPANPPEAREAAFRDMIAILKGRLDSVSGNYERITGELPKGIIFPEAQKVLQRHGWNLGDEKQSQPAQQQSTQQQQVAPRLDIEGAKKHLIEHPEDETVRKALQAVGAL